ncbi:DUF4352 domain-containing protein [Kribbella pittospori]|uniref:DUF4352 domain-containing protein n=1 Tax=Kribbella pittospori TaxID=722689 RepID=A0A4R0KJV9_9ACTN|nr:DUF4352 domain-containing protein [Kribbella pittospori]TCC55985.1 DUF4352 domain-containing protein [Kribbella pittospori]
MSQYQQGSQYQPGPPQQPVKKRHTLRNTVIVVTMTFVVLAGGCAAVLANGLDEATKESTATKAEASTTASLPSESQTSASPADPPASEEPTATPTDEDRVAKVGATQWFEYSDGMKVQVTSLKRFRISQYAAGGKPGDVGVIATVTLQNGSTNTFDTGLVDVKLASGPNGDQAESVFDTDQNLGGGFEGSILPGKKKTARYGFAIPKANVSSTLQLEVAPGWDYEGSHFEGKLSS